MRALIGQLFQETNSFNPIPTTRESFVVRVGTDMMEGARGTGTIIGGIISELDSQNIQIIPTISAVAQAGGAVEHAVFLSFIDTILESASLHKPDVVILELHGAMMTDQTSDCEGDFLGRLRDIIGPNIPIAVGLDLHAHMTDKMFQAADILVPCKNNPHSDFPETGQLTAHLALRMQRGEINPIMTSVKIPMLLAGMTETHEGPLHDAHSELKQWKSIEPHALDASLCNCQPFLDAPDMGQTVLLITDGDPAPEETALTIATNLWNRRREFVNRFTSIDDALIRVRMDQTGRPFVLSDYGDRTNAGAPGDGTTVMAALIERYPDLKSAISITDPEAVELSKNVGVGGVIELMIGGKFTPSAFAPYKLKATVSDLRDGTFREKGPLQAGELAENGDTAVLVTGKTTIVVTPRPARTQDVMFYEGQGMSISSFDLVVVKSGNHFQLSYAGVATPIKLESPGVGAYRPGKMPVARDPIYPEIETEDPCLSATIHN